MLVKMLSETIILHRAFDYLIKLIERNQEYELVKIDENHVLIKVKGDFYSITLLPDFGICSFPKIELINSGKVVPHTNIEGDHRDVCIIDREKFIIQSMSYEELIDLSLEQFDKLLDLSDFENKIEIRRDFLYFWNHFSGKKESVISYIKTTNTAKEIKLIELKIKGENFKTYYAKDDKQVLNNQYHKIATLVKGIFIPLTSCKNITPPQKGKEWTLGELLWILRNPLEDKISAESYNMLKKLTVKGYHLYIIFKMKLDNGTEILYTLKLNFKNNLKAHFFERIENDLASLEVVYTTRHDIEFLQKRIGLTEDSSKRKVLIVGCGSLGSYILRELPNLGVMEYTLIDGDGLEPGNVLRHTSGIDSVGKRKVNSLKSDLERQYPQLRITAKASYLDRALLESLELEKFDLVLFATGSTDLQLMFNDYVIEKGINITIMFTWLESKGAAGHALLIDSKYPGCFRCLLHDDEGNFIDNKYSYTTGSYDEEQVIEDGCGGSYTHYGNSVLLRTCMLVIDIITDLFIEKKTLKNSMFSIKNRKIESVNYTERYFESNMNIQYVDDFLNKGCDCNIKKL